MGHRKFQTHQIGLRVDHACMDLLQQKADRHGMSHTSYARKLLYDALHYDGDAPAKQRPRKRSRKPVSPQLEKAVEVLVQLQRAGQDLTAIRHSFRWQKDLEGVDLDKIATLLERLCLVEVQLGTICRHLLGPTQ